MMSRVIAKANAILSPKPRFLQARRSCPTPFRRAWKLCHCSDSGPRGHLASFRIRRCTERQSRRRSCRSPYVSRCKHCCQPAGWGHDRESPETEPVQEAGDVHAQDRTHGTRIRVVAGSVVGRGSAPDGALDSGQAGVRWPEQTSARRPLGTNVNERIAGPVTWCRCSDVLALSAANCGATTAGVQSRFRDSWNRRSAAIDRVEGFPPPRTRGGHGFPTIHPERPLSRRYP